MSQNSNKRQQQVKDGVFDGRYKTKVIPDMKKQERKKKARKKVNPGTQE